MNLDNFSDKLRITVDVAFNYAKDNRFNYFYPIHILIILLQDDNLISKTLKELKVNKQALLDESIKISNEQNNNAKETQVQSNVVLLLNKINDQISKYKANNSESLIVFMELASDISPVTKKTLNKFGIKYEDLKNFLIQKCEQSKYVQINDESLVSLDYAKKSSSAYIDIQWLKVSENTVKIVLWYDNEWAYSNRVLDLAEQITKKS